jgi:integrase
LWTLALYGLRRGEIAGLRWCNVNLTDEPISQSDDELRPKAVRIVENRVAIGSIIDTGTPKSKASNRTLPLPDDVVGVLKAARKRQLEERLAFGEGYGSDDYVALRRDGPALSPQSVDIPLAPDAGQSGHQAGSTA